MDAASLLIHLSGIRDLPDPIHFVRISGSSFQTAWPFFEVTSEIQPPGPVAVALVSGGGWRRGAMAARFGAQGKYYFPHNQFGDFGVAAHSSWTTLHLPDTHAGKRGSPDDDISWLPGYGSLESARIFGRSYVTTGVFAFVANPNEGHHLFFEVPIGLAVDTYLGSPSLYASEDSPKHRVFLTLDIKVGWRDGWIAMTPSRLCPEESR